MDKNITIEQLRKMHPTLNITLKAWKGEEPFEKNTYNIESPIHGGIVSNVPLDIWYCNTCRVFTYNGKPFLCTLLKVSDNLMIDIVYGEIKIFGAGKLDDINDINYLKKIYKQCKCKKDDSEILKMVKSYIQDTIYESLDDLFRSSLVA